MKTRTLLKYCTRIQFWAAKAADLRASHIEALRVIKNTDVDEYRVVMRAQSVRIGKIYLFCIARLKRAENDLKTELNNE